MGLMCKVLKVSRSGYYAWRRREKSGREKSDEKLAEAITEIHVASRRTYGSPRIHAELGRRGHRCGRKRVARLMREGGIRAKGKRRFRVSTTDSNHDLPIAPNLVERRFSAEGPDKLWVADITYVPTEEGWLYVASILDVFSRRVVGWACAAHMKTSLVLDALNAALTNRQPEPGLVHHSDRGAQYASHAYREALDARGIVCSMSRRGNCLDNAMKESFFRSLKVECVDDERFETRSQARSAVFDYVEIFYNRTRLHSSLGFLSPVDFEADRLTA